LSNMPRRPGRRQDQVIDPIELVDVELTKHPQREAGNVRNVGHPTGQTAQ
jgi:hypothetical protein